MHGRGAQEADAELQETETEWKFLQLYENMPYSMKVWRNLPHGDSISKNKTQKERLKES